MIVVVLMVINALTEHANRVLQTTSSTWGAATIPKLLLAASCAPRQLSPAFAIPPTLTAGTSLCWGQQTRTRTCRSPLSML
ncbi:Variant-specific surface protein [Giardia duodenalis assemblage B]|uniref:Variant-specific surface protein n=1 Tax=Giardia duodenalis assemblage B TaxID=1394984 RepID=A0A132NMT4_GIAIN|nr:Variant-specific surface protein [Giardia intestinalis assemblage B]